MQSIEKLMAPKHNGMRVSAIGLLKNAKNALPKEASGEKWALNELSEHLQELGDRFYSGDIKVVDEFLQLYCLDRLRDIDNVHREV